MESDIIQPEMEEEVLQGADTSFSNIRLGAVQKAADKVRGGKIEVESTKIRQGVSDTVRELESETDEVFPDKETDSPEMKTAKEKSEADAAAKEGDAKKGKRILGMKPLVAAGVAVVLIVAGIIIYTKFIKKK